MWAIAPVTDSLPVNNADVGERGASAIGHLQRLDL